jgi:precorrin-6A/cobalt-precorrin-6A reductase
MLEVLILGGTAEAAELARALDAMPDIRATVSLAGRTRRPAGLAGQVRIGGFGGPAGLAAYLAEHRIEALIDATHPFSPNISENARLAAEQTGTPRLALVRPPWTPRPGEAWRVVGDESAAAATLPAGARAFLALGHQRLAPFAVRSDAWFLVRTVDAPERPPLPGPHEVVTGRGPFGCEDEKRLLAGRAITHLVCRNSGGAGGRAKLDAAHALGLTAVVIARPPAPAGPHAASVAEAVDWLTGLARQRGGPAA